MGRDQSHARCVFEDWVGDQMLRIVKSLGFWVAIAVFGVISLGVVLSFTYWDWLQGGTDRSGNGGIPFAVLHSS